MCGLAGPTLELSLALCESNVVQRTRLEDVQGECGGEEVLVRVCVSVGGHDCDFKRRILTHTALLSASLLTTHRNTRSYLL